MPIWGRIVVGYDGSAGSEAALRLAAVEAAATGAELHIVHAQLTRPEYALLLPPGAVGSATDEASRLVDSVRGRVQTEHPDLNVRVTIAATGAAAALVRAARGSDLLIVGRAGAGRARVAAHVVAYASCPVTVVGVDVPLSWDSRRPVVLGYDLAAGASPAVPHAFHAAQARRVGLSVCHVRFPDDGYWSRDAEVRRAVTEALAGWRAAFADVPVAVDVLAGVDPAVRLLDAAAEAAMIVVGDRRSGGSGRIADGLIREAACPVTVVLARSRVEPLPAAVG